MRVKRFSLEGPLARTGRNKPRSSAWLPRTRAQPLNGRNLHLVVVDQGAPHAYDAAAGPFPFAFSSSGITPSRYSKNKVLFTVSCAYAHEVHFPQGWAPRRTPIMKMMLPGCYAEKSYDRILARNSGRYRLDRVPVNALKCEKRRTQAPPSRYSKNKALFTVPCAYRVRRVLRGGASLGLWGGALRSVDAKGGKTAPIDVV